MFIHIQVLLKLQNRKIRRSCAGSVAQLDNGDEQRLGRLALDTIAESEGSHCLSVPCKRRQSSGRRLAIRAKQYYRIATRRYI